MISLAGLDMVLGGPGHYRYRSVGASSRSKLELSVDGGPYTPVAARVSEGSWRGPPVDPSRFSPTVLRGLRGLSQGSFIAPGTLRHLDLDTTAISLVRRVSPLPQLDLPEPRPLSLPQGLRYLRIQAGAGEVARALRTLGDAELRYLVLDLRDPADDQPFDARSLARLTKLEHLRVRGASSGLSHPEALGSLVNLRSLDLSGLHALTSLDFIAHLSRLRRLDVRDANIVSLEPLRGHPSLEVVRADDNPLARLPSVPPPRLRWLSITATAIEHELAEAFADRARGARVDRRLAQVLADVTACATRIRVRTGGLCHRRPQQEETLFEITDPQAVRDSLELFAVTDEGSGFHCMCCGSPTIEFYRHDQLLAELGFHHGRSLRWSGWTGDALLADDRVDHLCQWMTSHGAETACKDRK